MGNLTVNFSTDEFQCPCSKCTSVDVVQDLVEVLQEVRDHFGSRIKITSGFRCQDHNAKIGGAARSKHTQGIAADFMVEGVKPIYVSLYLHNKYPGTYGIGFYKGWTHLDVRTKFARWIG